MAVVAFAVSSSGQQAEVLRPDHSREQIIAREKWQMQGRKYSGMNPAALRYHAIQQKLKMRAMQANALSFVNGGWTSLGPLPLPSDASGSGLQDYSWVSGRATAVAVDPNDLSGNTVYAGGAYGGVWKSTNAGPASANPGSVSWTALTDNQPTLAIGAIAVQPQLTNPNPATSVILAGTGETNSSADSYYGLGILRSGDAGQTWTLISQDASGTRSFAGLGFSQIAFSTTNPNLVVAGAASVSDGIVEGLENPVSVNRGIYYSTDAGITWHAATIADAGATITASSVTSVVYNAAAAKFYAAVRFHGFYWSSDGVNWTRLSSQPGTMLSTIPCPAQTAQPSSCPIYRGEIAVLPPPASQPTRTEMYVWFVDANDDDEGIWQSVNSGVSWVQINDSAIANCGDLFGGCGTAQGTYDLALSAVPDGTATDLYAGAINLYKCTITNAFPACNGAGKNSFLNLTHVYGCSDIAKVHPDQHAIDFMIANGASLLYFANDGGIYRALDGFTGLTTGTCGQSNLFDSLNATLGPMTQFVSVAESSTDVNLLFGGTQDNGAPATGFSQSSGSWVNVDAGDNGYTAVNPSNGNEWFVATPPNSISGVNLFRCANGVSCHTEDFQNDQVADSNQLGGDTGAFYFPFILDPASSSTLLVGTCRIWRGASSGGGFSVLSPDFETGGSGACTGNEVNLVRTLAAGGPKDSSGYSQVIYAGTSGEGPSIQTTPAGGHVWVTMNADNGATSWADRTAAINPQAFPVSAIALDPSDATGKTAYVTIMGFHTSHVWKTTNAGVSWTDFSGTAPNSVPDAPVNSILIDPTTSSTLGTIYLGTDVGVFASSTSAPSWIEVGPGPGQPGFLPNLAVTSLKIFNSGGVKRLRAATYGRGLWEWNLITTPDFQLAINNNPQTVFAGSAASFSGTISAINAYNTNANLSCTAGSTPVPPTCSVVPSSVLPTPTGAGFAVNASGPAGDYSFNLHAVGTDAASVTHDFALTLHIVDFTLSAPSQSTVTVAPGATSAPVSFTVSAAGPFSSSVTLSCTGLPPGASCAFQPSNATTPTSGNPATVTLSINATTSAISGSSIVTITATTSGGPAKTSSLTLIVSATPDYALAIANPSVTTQAGSNAVFNGTLTAVNGYNNAVALSCGSGAPPGCVISPASVTPAADSAQFTVTANSSTSKSYSFNVNGVGSDAAAVAHSAPVTLTVLPLQTFDFSMGINPQLASVPAGQSTTYTVEVNPTTSNFPSAVTFSCSNLPALTTCSFSPSQVGAGNGNSTVALTITTTAPSHASGAESILLLSLPLAGLFWMGAVRSRRDCGRMLALALVAFSGLCCGGGLQGNNSVAGGGSGNPGTPKGTYNITVTATCGSVTHSGQATLTVN